MSVLAASPFIARCRSLTVDNLLEGAFWSSWCGMSLKNWSEALGNRGNVVSEPIETAEKADRLWEANKNLIFKSFSAFAGLTMVICWAVDAKLFFLGKLYTVISSGGYGASAIASSFSLWNETWGLVDGIDTYNGIQDPHLKGEEALIQIHNLLKVSFYVCLVAWAALSSVYIAVGGELLFQVSDAFIYYGLCLLVAIVGSSFFLPERS